MTISVLFVCLGNICRSPTAHGIFEHKIREAGLSEQVEIDSAGTAAWHIGKSPDARSAAAALQRGYDLSHLRARQSDEADFEHYDYILAMDESNLMDLRALSPANYRGHLGLFLEFARTFNEREVPDPYYGGNQGFEHVLDLVEDACEGLLNDVRQRL
ncbi:low molecular weight protein-tyrosine-phosphatase [Marinimicrobium sp. ARAG 43.8]|uniref:low molecular weight protein-tyrosine-phosphatase n=1 Tax=Marinimicrobium sp. ARAG 43.8 TaxID=3418719 RepID=UPI003CEC2EAA